MNKFIRIFTVAAILSAAPFAKADWKDLLGKVAKGADKNDITNIVGDIVGGKISYEEIVGEWEYKAPAITFASENVLKKTGGAAAATTLESKIDPFYKKAKLNSLKVTFDADKNFTMAIKKVNLKGTVTIDDNGQYIFNFQALGQYNIGEMNAFIEKSGNDIKLTFDISKLMELAEKISSISNNATFKSMSDLLNSYDGLNAGFRLKKVS